MNSHTKLFSFTVQITSRKKWQQEPIYPQCSTRLYTTRFSSVKLIFLYLACECYVLSKYCFEDGDMYGGLDWANQTFHKFTNDDPSECVDIEKLNFYIISTSMYTGNTKYHLRNKKYRE